MQVEPWAHRGGGVCSTSHTDTVSEQSAPFHPNGHWQLQTDTGRLCEKLVNAVIPFAILVLCNWVSIAYWCLVSWEYQEQKHCRGESLSFIKPFTSGFGASNQNDYTKCPLCCTYYTDEPESTHVPPCLQWTWTQGVTPHWPTLRPKAGCPAGWPSTWNFLSLLVRNCTSKMHPLERTNTHTVSQSTFF